MGEVVKLNMTTKYVTEVRSMIEQALKKCNNFMTFDDILDKVTDGSLLWFCNVDSFALLEPYRAGKHALHVHVLIAGGSQNALYDLEQNYIIPFARSIGANKLTTLMRKGFLRGRLNEGWKAPCVYVEKEI